VGILCGNEVAASGELETAKIMRDTLKEHLISIEDRSKGGLQRPTWSKIINSSAGPYEESTEYFAYGILDLMYQLSFWIQDRSSYFVEMINAVRLVLGKSSASLRTLRYKAIDLHRRIQD
jgi:hypothetical protein